MDTNNLKTKRPWSWKVYFVLIGLNILAILAYKVYRSALPSASTSSGWSSYFVLILENIGCITVGLILANRIGLGLPFIEGWGKRQPAPMNFRRVVAIAWLAGIAVGVLLMVLSLVVFEPSMQAMFQQLGIASPKVTAMSPLYGFLASFYAGITEETFCRLAGLTLVAWLGGLLFHHPDGRPKLAVLWVANIAFALYLGFGHLQTASGLGWPLNPLVVTRGFLLNGIAGLVFGWLYWKYGFESAILAHFFADIIPQVAYPFISQWQGEAARNAAFTGVAVVILLTLIWAARSIVVANRKGAQVGVLKAA
jgi:hypothetical protein